MYLNDKKNKFNRFNFILYKVESIKPIFILITIMNLLTTSQKDEKFANVALQEAEKSNMKYHQHGCVAVMDGCIIARGHNSTRAYSNDGYLNNTCSCHAEIDVLRKINKINNKNGSLLKKISMYVVRKPVKKYYFKESSPCFRCLQFMKSLHIKYIIWSNQEGELSKCKVNDYYMPRPYLTSGDVFMEDRLEQ